MRDLDAGLARYLELERTPTPKRAAAKLCGLRKYAGRVHATFVRAARQIFRDLGNFFARVGRKICVTSALDACFFGFECMSDSVIQRAATLCSLRSARWPNARNFYARSSLRAGFPEFCKLFAQIFAQNLRELDAGSPHHLA